MATWKNLITDPTTKPMITNSGTTKFGDTIQFGEYGNIITRP